jgi:hypothetical protein
MEDSMYGLVNKAVRGMVIEGFGENIWRKIHTKAGVPSEFVPMQAYDDSVTYGLVGAAVEVLDIPAEKILFGFGEYWVLKVATVHYADVMARSGTDFLAFVQDLDQMHQRMESTFPDYRAPSFRVSAIADGSFTLDYYSEREGLLPFVEGLMSALGQHFKESVRVEHVSDDHGLPCKRMLIHHKPV